MGNAGSAHNLESQCVQSQLNLYYTQQYLRRTTGDTKKKDQVASAGRASTRNFADCKVLPNPTENLKLRATTNGAILQAGGTISFRAKEQTESKKETSSIHPMRRCHTLILDGQNDKISQRKSAPPPAEFRRSQTLLHVGYTKRKSQENAPKNFEFSRQTPVQNTSTASTLKVNKYNKKRKAPPAPTNNSKKNDETSPAQNQLFNDIKSPSLTKPRIYATNINKPQFTQKPQFQSPGMKAAPFQRDSNVRTSVNSSGAFQRANSSYSSKLPYRREKSFDANFLRQKETNEFSDRHFSTQTREELPPNNHKLENKLDSNAARSSQSKKKLSRQRANIPAHAELITLNNYHNLGANHLRNKPKIVERLREEDQAQFSLPINAKKSNFMEHTNERKARPPQSRIPQLKRTFYFGMESHNKPPNLPTPSKNEKLLEENDDFVMLNHNIEDDEEILDNGILVHVRPTLPKRQLETPSFSPAAAWRNLLEEQQRLQLERSKPKQSFPDTRIIEMPICLNSSTTENYVFSKANWTPQQDLEEDDDDDDDVEEEGGDNTGREKCKTLNIKRNDKPENYPNSLHIFSLSLPRDVHLQCQKKSSLEYTEQENNIKAANCWLVPGFNSLQKFKTQLGKNTDFRLNAKCTCAANSTIKRNSFQQEKSFVNSLATDSKCYHQAECELNTTSAKPSRYQNDNWLLHKSKSKSSPLTDVAKTVDENCLKASVNSLSFVNFQPKYLSNICSGKHIVYLPGQEPLDACLKDNYRNTKQNKTTKSTYKRQRQRQENVRENLQDLSPIQNIHQSNVNTTEKSTHRFSFQSTVRVLEKRRLAEKLSKDAEVQEAQRLHELEAMKRVEEDFQRKRAPEKANLRNQLRLHFKSTTENAENRSLPLNINEKYNIPHTHDQNISDVNNNIFCRAEPDGAVSPSLELNDDLPIRHPNFLLSGTKSSKNLECYEYDGEESETHLPDLHCSALLIEPYLNSMI